MSLSLQKPGFEDTSVAAGLTIAIWGILYYGQAYLQAAITTAEIAMLTSFSRIISEPKPVTFITFGLLLLISQQLYAWRTRK